MLTIQTVFWSPQVSWIVYFAKIIGFYWILLVHQFIKDHFLNSSAWPIWYHCVLSFSRRRTVLTRSCAGSYYLVARRLAPDCKRADASFQWRRNLLKNALIYNANEIARCPFIPLCMAKFLWQLLLRYLISMKRGIIQYNPKLTFLHFVLLGSSRGYHSNSSRSAVQYYHL